MSEVNSLDVFNCFWLVKLADLVRAKVSLRTLPITGSPLCETWFWNQQLIIKLLCFRPVMLADQVRAAAASGHSQDLACLLANPDPNKFAPDLVLYTLSVLTFNTVNSLSSILSLSRYTFIPFTYKAVLSNCENVIMIWNPRFCLSKNQFQCCTIKLLRFVSHDPTDLIINNINLNSVCLYS